MKEDGARIPIGGIVQVRGIQCRVFRVLAFGTYDVESLCGRYAYRITGIYRAPIFHGLDGVAPSVEKVAGSEHG